MEDRDSAPIRKGSRSLVVGGYLAALFLPLLGLFLGIALLFRRRRHGIAVIVLSITVGIVFLIGVSGHDDQAGLPPGAKKEAESLAHCVLDGPRGQEVEERIRICERRLD